MTTSESKIEPRRKTASMWCEPTKLPDGTIYFACHFTYARLETEQEAAARARWEAQDAEQSQVAATGWWRGLAKRMGLRKAADRD